MINISIFTVRYCINDTGNYNGLMQNFVPSFIIKQRRLRVQQRGSFNNSLINKINTMAHRSSNNLQVAVIVFAEISLGTSFAT